MTTDKVLEFQAGTRELAMYAGYPVLTPTGTFVPDARAAWLVEAVEEWHVSTQRPRTDKGWFHASSLGKTDEELIAQYRGEDAETHDARKLRIFDLGHNRDKAWKGYLLEAGLSHVEDDSHRLMRLNWLRLTGECDDIAMDPQGRLCIVEIKTKAQHLFSRLEEPDAAHKLQVQAYMGGMGIDQAIVIYEAKNDQSIKAFYEAAAPAVWQEIAARLRRLRREAEA